MCSRFLSAAGFLIIAAQGGPPKLRFCVEPNNMPFSNQRLEGFENKLALMLARELHAEPDFVWWAQRRGYIRNTIGAGLCDVLMGIPTGTEQVLTTEPYYRSAFALLVPAGRSVNSLDDPRLRRMRIGLHLAGEDYIPPGHVLAGQGLQSNLVGYSMSGDVDEDEPAGKLARALDEGAVDVAVMWGPFAGYFARQRKGAVRVVLASHSSTAPNVPLSFSISLGVRPDNRALLRDLNAVLTRRSREIRALLDSFGVPEV